MAVALWRYSTAWWYLFSLDCYDMIPRAGSQHVDSLKCTVLQQFSGVPTWYTTNVDRKDIAASGMQP